MSEIGRPRAGSPIPADRAARHRDVDAESRLAVPEPVRTDTPGVVFVTGMPGAGKTTVARSLARSFVRGAHVEEDWIWWWLTMSGASGTGDGEDFKRERSGVFMRNVASLVDNFAREGFVPIVDGAIMRRSWLRDRLSLIATRPAFLVVLAPDDGTSRARDAARSGISFYDEYPEFSNTLRHEFGGEGVWIDSARMTLADTVRAVLEKLESGRLNEH